VDFADPSGRKLWFLSRRSRQEYAIFNATQADSREQQIRHYLVSFPDSAYWWNCMLAAERDVQFSGNIRLRWSRN